MIQWDEHCQFEIATGATILGPTSLYLELTIDDVISKDEADTAYRLYIGESKMESPSPNNSIGIDSGIGS